MRNVDNRSEAISRVIPMLQAQAGPIGISVVHDMVSGSGVRVSTLLSNEQAAI